jgi:hypothetical protein
MPLLIAALAWLHYRGRRRAPSGEPPR